MKLVALMARHGETEENAKGIFRSRSNPPLDANGIKQAHEAARFMGKFPISLILASPLDRSQHTAKIAAKYLGAKVETDGRLLGWDVGILTGKKKTKATEAYRDWYVAHPDKVIPKGESIHQGEERFDSILKDALSYSASGHIPLLETHGSGIKFAQTVLTGKRSLSGDSSLVEPGGVVGIYSHNDKFELRPLFRRARTGESS